MTNSALENIIIHPNLPHPSTASFFSHFLVLVGISMIGQAKFLFTQQGIVNVAGHVCSSMSGFLISGPGEPLSNSLVLIPLQHNWLYFYENPKTLISLLMCVHK